MRVHIDWLTFTMVPRYESAEDNRESLNEAYANAIERVWHSTFDPATLAGAFGGEWQKQERSRAPYTDAWTLHGAGITLFAGISLNHCCVEISGGGCEILIEKNLLYSVLGAVVGRVTRIDIACDIETDVTPMEFVNVTSHKRMRSSGYQKSATGETCYVGSRTSERYARVYRYAEPHPRAHLLRAEHVFHKAYAKKVARAILDHGSDAVARSAGEAFGWMHDTWQPSNTHVPDLSIVSAEREAGKTITWLISSVAPAFKRLCEDGTIRDPEAFLTKYFRND